MQRTRTCPSCGAHIADDPGLVDKCERLVILGPPLVEHQSRDYFGRPVGVVGVDDAGILIVDD